MDVNHAREEMNLSEWGTENTDAQRDSLLEICRKVKARGHAASVLQILHRDAVLTSADVATLCTWSDAARRALRARRSVVHRRDDLSSWALSTSVASSCRRSCARAGRRAAAARRRPGPPVWSSAYQSPSRGLVVCRLPGPSPVGPLQKSPQRQAPGGYGGTLVSIHAGHPDV